MTSLLIAAIVALVAFGTWRLLRFCTSMTKRCVRLDEVRARLADLTKSSRVSGWMIVELPQTGLQIYFQRDVGKGGLEARISNTPVWEDYFSDVRKALLKMGFSPIVEQTEHAALGRIDAIVVRFGKDVDKAMQALSSVLLILGIDESIGMDLLLDPKVEWGGATT